MGWQVPWYSTVDSFNTDCNVSAAGFGLDVFLREGEATYRTHFTSGRDVEMLGSIWSFLDLTPQGRQEVREDAPARSPQPPPSQWRRRHDDYDGGAGGDHCCG